MKRRRFKGKVTLVGVRFYLSCFKLKTSLNVINVNVKYWQIDANSTPPRVQIDYWSDNIYRNWNIFAVVLLNAACSLLKALYLNGLFSRDAVHLKLCGCRFTLVKTWTFTYNVAKEQIYAMCLSNQAETTEFKFLDENFGWLNKFQTEIHCIENSAGPWFRTFCMTL